MAESVVCDAWFGVMDGDARLKASFYGHSAIAPVSDDGLKPSHHSGKNTALRAENSSYRQ